MAGFDYARFFGWGQIPQLGPAGAAASGITMNPNPGDPSVVQAQPPHEAMLQHLSGQGSHYAMAPIPELHHPVDIASPYGTPPPSLPTDPGRAPSGSPQSMDFAGNPSASRLAAYRLALANLRMGNAQGGMR